MTEIQIKNHRAAELLGSQYAQSVGRVTYTIRQQFNEWLDSGLDPRLISKAINETAAAPMPSLRYLRAIVARYIKEGIKTSEQAAAPGSRLGGGYDIQKAMEGMY